MADTKISALTLATSVDGTEIAPIVQTGTNKRATLSTVKAYVVADATLLKTSAIGTTVQAYSANTVLDASYVHTDNNYTTTEKNKLSGIASGAEVNVNADWLAASGDAAILNKPTLATVATTGAYADLSGRPTLGTAAAAATTDFATAAQGVKADTALQPAAIGVTVQGYDADLTSWAAIAPSTKQDTLVSGTNIKTINGSNLLGAGDLTITSGGTPGGATTQVQFNDAGAFAGAAGLTIDTATGAIKTATDTVYELVGTVISATNGALQFKTLSGATTLTESLASGQAVTLEIYAGAFSVTWPTVYWLNTTSSTTAPILNTAGPTIIELWKRGTTLYGSKVA